MNSKGTEFSIFQGAPSIHVDNNQQRFEEEEALKDQARRHAEVKASKQPPKLNKFNKLLISAPK